MEHDDNKSNPVVINVESDESSEIDSLDSQAEAKKIGEILCSNNIFSNRAIFILINIKLCIQDYKIIAMKYKIPMKIIKKFQRKRQQQLT